MPIKLLAIDDDPADRLVVSRLLHDSAVEQFEVTAVGCLREAVQALSEAVFDGVLLDLSLPDATGLHALEAVLATIPDVPVVVVTGRDQDEVAPELARLGAQDLISKATLESRSLARSVLCAIERNRLRTSLVAQNHDLHDFAHRASHDLRAPVRRMRALIRIADLELESGSVETARTNLGHAERLAGQMLSSIESLLELASLERDPVDANPVDLGVVAGVVRASLADELERSGGQLLVGELPWVCGNAAWISSLLQNLIENAIHCASDEPPRIEISAREAGGEVEVTVTDNGVGLDEERSAALFEPFARGSAGSAHAGFGIGLASCKTIVDRLGGRIWATSAGPGTGSTFHFTLAPATR